MGIAIVIPSEKIVKVIDQDDLREQRQRLDAQAIASSLPTADTADSDRPEMTRGEFFDALGKIKKQPPEPSQSD